jgi:CheY-like chemotaxis protein
MSNTSLAMLDNTAMATVGDCLRDIQNGASRARDLTQQLITYSRAGSPLRFPVALPALVREAAAAALTGSAARCDFEFAPDLWPASVDRDQAGQALQNLFLQAAAAGGRIRVALNNESVAAAARSGLRPGRYVRLTVSDSGPGLGPDSLARIFEPYFSTKKPGNGLGLATVYAIAKRHEGHIEVESSPGGGTTFHLWLAAAETATGPATPPAASRNTVNFSHGARVLVMDDEGTILRVTAALLKRMGLEATVVSNGDDAVRAFGEARDAGRPFALLIFDLTIPGGMGGQAAIELIRQTDLEVPAIVSSGYLNDPVMADFASHGFQAMITKPYVVNDLARTVQHVLARSSHGRLAATG